MQNEMSRRRWLERAAVTGLYVSPIVSRFASGAEQAGEPENIASQLFVDRVRVASIKNARLVFHQPTKREIAIKPEHSWEQSGVSYMVAIRDQGKFRAWYRVDPTGLNNVDRRSMTAYAESNDGVHWRKPELGLVEYDGSTANNLVWNGPPVFNLAPFRDDNPQAAADEKYKAVGRGRDLYSLVSVDGLR